MAKRLQHLPTNLLHAVGNKIGLAFYLHGGKEIDIETDVDIESAWRRFKKFLEERITHLGMPTSLIPGSMSPRRTGGDFSLAMTDSLMKVFRSPWFFGLKAECGEDWTEHVQGCSDCQLRIIQFMDEALRRIVGISDREEHFYEQLAEELEERCHIRRRARELRHRRSTDPPPPPEEARA